MLGFGQWQKPSKPETTMFRCPMCGKLLNHLSTQTHVKKESRVLANGEEQTLKHSESKVYECDHCRYKSSQKSSFMD